MSAPIGLVDTAVEQVQAQAEPLGLAWQIRIATVLAGDDPALVKLRLDGDTLATAVTFGISMLGPLAVGARVYVMGVPPAGQYVVGYARYPGFVDGVNVTSGTLISGVSAETDIPNLALSGTVLAGCTYLVTVQLHVSVTATSDDWQLFVRRDTALTGTNLLDARWSGDDLIGTRIWQWPFTATVTETLALFFSVARAAGAGTISVFGSPNGTLVRTHARLEFISPSGLWRTA
jgi:hypothetical protein